MVLDFLLLFSATLLLALAYLIGQRKPKNFPPGPFGLPILGHLPLLGSEPHRTAAAWVPRYGPVLGLDFASYRCVIISDHRLAREAFAHAAFCGRPALRLALDRSGGERLEGIVFTQGRAWREQRSFAHRRLRELGGFGTHAGGGMEAIITQQVHELIDGLRVDAKARRPVCTHARFNVAVVNALWALIAGRPFAQSDPEALRVTRIFVDAMAENSIFVMLPMFMPWFADNFPSRLTGRAGLERMYKPMLAFLAPYVAEHWRTHRTGQQRDFIDAFIDEVKAASDPESSFHQSRAHNSLATTLMDLFAAGTETTATTLTWICLLLASHPKVQERVAEEVRTIAYKEGQISLQHRRRMPYTEAMLHEVMRYRTVGPLAMFHSTTEPVSGFHGFDIPKATMVFINVWEAHNNRELWGDPENFRPERWLVPNANGDGGVHFERHEGFLAFSTGKRLCLGEQLARDQLFLFTTALVQAFCISVDPLGPVPDLEPKIGGTTAGPKPHRLLFTERVMKVVVRPEERHQA